MCFDCDKRKSHFFQSDKLASSLFAFHWDEYALRTLLLAVASLTGGGGEVSSTFTFFPLPQLLFTIHGNSQKNRIRSCSTFPVQQRQRLKPLTRPSSLRHHNHPLNRIQFPFNSDPSISSSSLLRPFPPLRTWSGWLANSGEGTFYISNYISGIRGS